jgi:hypothetical protein
MRCVLMAAMSLVVGCGSQARVAAEKQAAAAARDEAAAQTAEAARKAAAVAKPKAATDAFAVGSVFKGERAMPRLPHQKVVLVVTKREGADFEAEITLGDAARKSALRAKATGKAPVGNGTVAFSTDKVDKFQQSFAGDYRDGKLTFDCRGPNRTGETVEGKGVLEREK